MKQTRNKWQRFRGKSFKIVNLGRPAVFLIPAKKLRTRKGKKIRRELHLFLTSRIGDYTTSMNPSFGIYTNSSGKVVLDKCIEFEVSFVGKSKISILINKLAEFAKKLGEDCIYFKAGQYSCLIYPKPK